ncbi:MAG TPA: FAD-binding protein [Actinomycetota bacterium]|nr:FAD-binding protein [Actinomycetota bacterium]
MELIHPHTAADVAETVRDANASALRLLVVGGRRHADKGNACEIDGELWITQLDRLVAYEPAEMVVIVEAGMRVGELGRILAEGGQEWPSDAPDDSTVGGAIAADAQSPRRLRVGRIADTVLQARFVTGDGRLATSGARTVKNATGYDLHRVLVGSLGTLGVLVQVALKARPLPEARRTLHAPGPIETGEALLRAVPGPAGIVATPGEIEVRLEGWRDEVEEQTAAARAVVPELDEVDDGAFPSHRPWEEAPVVAEASVRPSALGALAVEAGERWGALVGVGVLWVGLEGPDVPLEDLRALASVLGGLAPVVRGPGGLGDASLPARAVQERLKAAFDPNGVLAPGRFWGGI